MPRRATRGAGRVTSAKVLRESTCEAAGLDLALDADAAVDELIADFERIVGGMLMLGERPARSVDEAVAIGERLSACCSRLSCSDGAGAPSTPPSLIVTDAVFGNASPLMDQTAAKPGGPAAALEAGTIPICTGLQRRYRGWTPHHSGPRRLGFLRLHSLGRAGRRPSCGSGPMWTAS